MSVPSPATVPLPAVLAPLEADLAVVGEAWHRILADLSPETTALLAEAGAFSGKRLRPALTCLGARLAGGRVEGDVATVAAIVELIHMATLVHDDVIDGAAMRRRRPTLNARLGETAAVLVGDVLFSKAYRAASWLEDPFAARYLSDVVGEVLEGEILQDVVARSADLPLATYERIIRGKTAALYEAALRVGAHYGGASAAVEDDLARFGHHLGMAFQIVDDRLDLDGDEDEVGKSLGTDLAEGKTTLAVILWRDACSDRAVALQAIEAAWDDPAAARKLCVRLREDGALRLAHERAEHEITAARARLDRLPKTTDRQLLEMLARYTLDRSR
ncbi:MAG: polyprenyl synthetase family protein [Planctomycetota bacterium]